MNTLSIYIHIPFCLKKCPYCDFNSIPLNPIPEKAYIGALLKEFDHLREGFNLPSRRLESIYIGGGTPSLLSPQAIQRILDGLKEGFSQIQDIEITLEANPGTVDLSRLMGFKRAGVNRLSLGVQSFNDKTLKTLGRIHSSGASLEAFNDARRAGFDNVGIDLIFGVPAKRGVPGQGLRDWEEDIEIVLTLRPEHISTYNLTIEKGTPFYKLAQEGLLTSPSDDEEAEMYESAISRFKRAGYAHYEISNFALLGMESRHNQRYWLYKDYIGLGAGAHSYVGTDFKSVPSFAVPSFGVRWWNEKAPFIYMKRIEGEGNAIEGREFLTREEAITEGIFLGLRRPEGLDKEWFLRHFGKGLDDTYPETIGRLKEGGLLLEEGRFIKLSHQGLLLSNEVFLALLP